MNTRTAAQLSFSTDEICLMKDGIREWWGSASPDRAHASALGYASVALMKTDLRLLGAALEDSAVLSLDGWSRVIASTRLVSSDRSASGEDWSMVTGFDQAETDELLASIEAKVLSHLN